MVPSIVVGIDACAYEQRQDRSSVCTCRSVVMSAGADGSGVIAPRTRAEALVLEAFSAALGGAVVIEGVDERRVELL